jgi:hypothetical protein
VVNLQKSQSVNAADPPEANDVQYQGHALGFVLASTITLWAVLGQLGTMMSFALDIKSGSMTGLFLVALSLSTLLVLIYAWTTIRSTLVMHGDHHETRSQVGAALHMVQLPDVEIPAERMPLPEWHVL